MDIILAAALLPAMILMLYVYNQDKVEKEPFGLLLALFGYGMLSCVPASILEDVFGALLDACEIQDAAAYNIIMCFGIIAIAEEGSKFFFLKRKTWKNPDFNYTFDGIVYAVFIGLGFAGLENILYVINYGFGVVISRGLLAIPGHCTFAIFMGLFYSRAKFFETNGYRGKARRSKRLAFIVPVLLHGFYDFCLMMPDDWLTYIFLVFVVIVDIAAFRTVKRQSREDDIIREDNII